MSDRNRSGSGDQRRRDAGMTLPELLIAIAVVGVIVTVLASSLVVTMRSRSGTEGRLNVARAEQTIGMWLPADLASADDVSDVATLVACPGEATPDGPCPGLNLGAGSNALLVTWSTLVSDNPATGERTYDYTYVSYYYSQASDGQFKLTRIECTKNDVVGLDPTGPGWSCSAVPVVSDLPAPLGWQPGDDVPDEVIAVTIPLEAGATDESQVVAQGQNTKNARRVIVTVHGGGSSDGAGGGRNTISITAGGTYRTEIDAASMLGAPTFVEARSKCGGPLTLLIDESSSIPDIAKVRQSVREFVKTLVGTPVKLQIITFSDYARTLAPGSATVWNHYFDLTNSADVTALIGNAPYSSGGLVDQISIAGNGKSGSTSGGARTNWEDALYRAFRTPDGLVPQTMPKTLIFFTDGIPTRDRSSSTSDGRPYRSTLDTQNPLAPVTAPGWGPTAIPDATSSDYQNDPFYAFRQMSFNRANYWANQARGTVNRMVGVFVGSALTETSKWITSPGQGYHLTVSGHTWETRQDFETQRRFELANAFQVNKTRDWESRLDYEKYDGSGSRTSDSNWIDETPTNYYNNIGNADYRIRTVGTTLQTRSSYSNLTALHYFTYRGVHGSFFRDNGAVTSSWESGVPEALYDANNTNSTDTDGWRISGWSSTSAAEYYANASNHKYRSTVSSGNWVDVTPTEYFTYRTGDTTNWRIRTTSNRSPEWYAVTEAEYDSYASTSSSNWRRNDITSKVYGGTAPFDGYDAPISDQNRPNVQILGELIAPGGAVQAEWDTATGSWRDLDADLYATTDWNRLTPALKAIALGECGGTLTLQTRKGSTAVSDPFVYQNSGQWDASGNQLSIVPSTVTTNLQFTTGTFDFEITSGLYRVVEVVPHNLSSIGNYSHAGWSCAAGVRQLTQGPLSVATNGFEVFSVPDSGWTGLRVKVAANEAVSCTQQVTGG